MPDNRQTHNDYQKQTFKEAVSLFQEPIPDDVQHRTDYLVSHAELTPEDRVLDVGTGIGVLIPYILGYGVKYIVGCDLSAEMLAKAKTCYPDVFFWCGDVIDIPSNLGPFDVVFFNAMFGNLWSQRDTLQITSTHLNRNGRIIISHPMGTEFTEQIHRGNPRLIPHSHPGEKQLIELIRGLPLKVQHFQEEESLYLCIMRYS